METRWMHITSGDFEELRKASKDVCVIPLGCIEKHGTHMPLGTDVMEAVSLCYEASQMETCCVAPPYVFGDVPENYPKMPKGSITISLETEMALLTELCDQIARNGYKKIIFGNCHGGNVNWLRTFLRKLENKEHNFVAMLYNLGSSRCSDLVESIDKLGADHYPSLTKEDIEVLRENSDYYRYDGHGGFCETSIMLNYYPDTVKLDRLGQENGLSTHATTKYKEHHLNIKDFGWFADFPNAYGGSDPIHVNPRIAKAVCQFEIEQFADAIRFVKEDDDCLKWHNEFWGSNL